MPLVCEEIIRVHRPAELVGDGPEGLAQYFLVGVGHGDRKLSRLITELWRNANDRAHGGVVREVFGL